MDDLYYYYKDVEHEGFYVALLVNHKRKFVTKGVYVKYEDIEKADFFNFLDEKTASNLIMGMMHNYYTIVEKPFRTTSIFDIIKLKKKYYIMNKYNENVENLKMNNILSEEEKLMNIFWEKQDIYYSLIDEQYNLIKKAMETISEEDKRKFIMGNEDATQYEITETIYEARKDPLKKKEMHELSQKLIETNTYYKEFSSLFKPISQAGLDYFIAACELDNFFQKELGLFSNEYKEKMEEYYNNGIILYWQKTPDLPIIDGKIEFNDILDYFIYDDCINLIPLIDLYSKKEKVGDSFIRKAEDLMATVDLIQLGHYRPALRNLFALLDGEHKKCADVMNGYYTKKEALKHGLDRAKRIEKLVNSICTEYYASIWEKVDNLYKKMLGKEKVENLPNRNSIIHGDYQDENIDVSSYDVIKVLFLYLTMRTVADYMCNMEVFIKIFTEELFAYLSNNNIDI